MRPLLAVVVCIGTILPGLLGQHLYYTDSFTGSVRRVTLLNATESSPSAFESTTEEVQTKDPNGIIPWGTKAPMGIFTQVSNHHDGHDVVLATEDNIWIWGTYTKPTVLSMGVGLPHHAGLKMVVRSVVVLSNYHLIMAIWRTESSWTTSGIYRNAANLQNPSLETANQPHYVRMIARSRCPDSIAISPDEKIIFWTDVCDGEIRSMDNTNSWATGHIKLVLMRNLVQPKGLAFNSDFTKVFFVANYSVIAADIELEAEYRINITDAKVIATKDYGAGVVAPAGLTVDKCGNNKVYWTDMCTGKIQRSDFDGYNIEDVVTGLRGPVGLSVKCPDRTSTTTTTRTTSAFNSSTTTNGTSTTFPARTTTNATTTNYTLASTTNATTQTTTTNSSKLGSTTNTTTASTTNTTIPASTTTTNTTHTTYNHTLTTITTSTITATNTTTTTTTTFSTTNTSTSATTTFTNTTTTPAYSTNTTTTTASTTTNRTTTTSTNTTITSISTTTSNNKTFTTTSTNATEYTTTTNFTYTTSNTSTTTTTRTVTSLNSSTSTNTSTAATTSSTNYTTTTVYFNTTTNSSTFTATSTTTNTTLPTTNMSTSNTTSLPVVYPTRTTTNSSIITTTTNTTQTYTSTNTSTSTTSTSTTSTITSQNSSTTTNSTLPPTGTTTNTTTIYHTTTSTNTTEQTTTTTTVQCSCTMKFKGMASYFDIMKFEAAASAEPNVGSCLSTSTRTSSTTNSTSTTSTTSTTTYTTSTTTILNCDPPTALGGEFALKAGTSGPNAVWLLACNAKYHPVNGNIAICNTITGKVNEPTPYCESEAPCVFTAKEALNYTDGNQVASTNCNSPMSHNENCQATCTGDTVALNSIKCVSGRLADWSVCMDGVTAEKVFKILAEISMKMSGAAVSNVAGCTTNSSCFQQFQDDQPQMKALLMTSLSVALNVHEQWFGMLHYKAMTARRLAIHEGTSNLRRLQAIPYVVGFAVVVPPYMQAADLLKNVTALSDPSSTANAVFLSAMKANGVKVSDIAFVRQPYLIESVVLRDATGAIIKPTPQAYASAPHTPTTPKPSDVSGTSSGISEENEDTAMIFGIIAGVIVGCCLCCVLSFFLFRRPAPQKHYHDDPKEPEVEAMPEMEIPEEPLAALPAPRLLALPAPAVVTPPPTPPMEAPPPARVPEYDEV